jgi:hypothetical protein
VCLSVLRALAASGLEADDFAPKRSELEQQRKVVLSMRRPISERKLQANRANAKRSTGPRTEAGKAASRKNALKHGILSRSIDLLPAIDLDSLMLERSLRPAVSGVDAALQEMSRIWGKLAKIVAFERASSQLPAGLESNARLICRYERMLTRQLHARIRECAGLEEEAKNEFRRKI